ncbi:MAG: PH domain-containing protein [Oscillospiraceae bacterium]|nr:PH domain-containing protein [Oscillospiraceae bacterium]
MAKANKTEQEPDILEHREREIMWEDRKRTFLGLPLSFTKYTLTRERLIIETGFWNRKRDDVRLYRIRDLSLSRKIGERVLGLGTITVFSSDASKHNFELLRIKDSEVVYEEFSDLVETVRKESGLQSREILHTDLMDSVIIDGEDRTF